MKGRMPDGGMNSQSNRESVVRDKLPLDGCSVDVLSFLCFSGKFLEFPLSHSRTSTSGSSGSAIAAAVNRRRRPPSAGTRPSLTSDATDQILKQLISPSAAFNASSSLPPSQLMCSCALSPT